MRPVNVYLRPSVSQTRRDRVDSTRKGEKIAFIPPDLSSCPSSLPVTDLMCILTRLYLAGHIYWHCTAHLLTAKGIRTGPSRFSDLG